MKYTKAPIREAIFDIRINQLEGKTYEDFLDIHELIKDKYVNKRKINLYEGTFNFDENKSSETNSFFRGIIFSDKNNQKQAQFRNDGFTLNYLSLYNSWDDFKTEASELWKVYLEFFPNAIVERIALRYINRIEIPFSMNGFEEYVVNIPPIPKVLPKMYKSFFSQIEVPCENHEYSAIITTTIETPTEKYIPYILDIDVYKNVNNNLNFEDFEYIREVKNLIFESCVTDKARSLFK